MNVRVLLASLAGAVTSFLLGWLVYGFLLHDFMEANTTDYPGLMVQEPSVTGLAAIFLSGLVSSFLYAFIFDKWAKAYSFVQGMKAGAIIAFCMITSFNLFMYAMMNLYSVTWLFSDIVIGTIFNAFIGGIIAWVLGLKKE